MRTWMIGALIGIALLGVGLGIAQAEGPAPQGRCSAYDASVDWLEAPYEHFSICYTAAYADDVAWVALWVDYAHRWNVWKYGIDGLRVARYWPQGPPGGGNAGYHGGEHAARLHVSIMLLPTSDRFASASPSGSSTRFMLANGVYDGVDYGPSEGAVRFAYIPYVTPSSPDWGDSDGYGTLRGRAPDYHAHYLMHEYTHAAQQTILQGEPERPRHWNHVPHWITEGLAEYEGNAHTTTYNSTVQYENLLRYVVETIPDRIFCCENLTGAQSISTTDAYFGGRLILYWLADAIGEDVHVRLLRHDHDTFAEALTAELAAADMTMQEAWSAFTAWVAAEYALLEG